VWPHVARIVFESVRLSPVQIGSENLGSASGACSHLMFVMQNDAFGLDVHAATLQTAVVVQHCTDPSSKLQTKLVLGLAQVRKPLQSRKNVFVQDKNTQRTRLPVRGPTPAIIHALGQQPQGTPKRPNILRTERW